MLNDYLTNVALVVILTLCFYFTVEAAEDVIHSIKWELEYGPHETKEVQQM